ncbi:unnamed protein product [Symbiodinium sp. CCMP2592]|nr:unnamed protein product [Symbiodinium sp. CCMP2592]
MLHEASFSPCELPCNQCSRQPVRRGECVSGQRLIVAAEAYMGHCDPHKACKTKHRTMQDASDVRRGLGFCQEQPLCLAGCCGLCELFFLVKWGAMSVLLT